MRSSLLAVAHARHTRRRHEFESRRPARCSRAARRRPPRRGGTRTRCPTIQGRVNLCQRENGGDARSFRRLARLRMLRRGVQAEARTVRARRNEAARCARIRASRPRNAPRARHGRVARIGRRGCRHAGDRMGRFRAASEAGLHAPTSFTVLRIARAAFHFPLHTEISLLRYVHSGKTLDCQSPGLTA